VERIGPIRETTFGRLVQVKVNPGAGPGSNAYTTFGLTPHTDLPSREYQPG
jgi:gamma-butyrobetaine dioxygenase